MTEKLITNQPDFLYADTHQQFLQKNNIKDCYDIKKMYHQCMNQEQQKFALCHYLYNMMFICSTLEYKEQSNK